MFDKLRDILRKEYEEIDTNLFVTAEGLLRISLNSNDVIIVEFADNGIEADNGLFDDIGFYDNEDSQLYEILKDIGIRASFN